ncbi:hydantoinase/oxoprolinase family protein [Patulibacter minatonensis]|uniref:hydantoinase/oxoprolinase family protein n=1 Tax=Patulibacter minatonensis TaxID=298163 RepID=UPI00047CD25E|nr:hydantoinase/oxoprolinase family protein [Patulibacter minatonensis]
MLGVDVGGTFTDVVSVQNGVITVAKVATNVGETHKGVIAGAVELGVENAPVFNHASTHGLNAVITRRLPKIGFLTTEGHRDIPDMGRAWRPQEALTDPTWTRPWGDVNKPLVPRYLRRGIAERLTADGGTLIPLDEDQARAELEVLKRCGVQGVAICLINAYVDGKHEVRLAELAREVLGDVPVSISSEVSPLAKEYTRASTTIVDVFMKLIYTDYARKLDDGLRAEGFKGQLNLADCMARLSPVEVAMKTPFKIVFAGPAAGTVSSAYFGEPMGLGNLLCADIGGTSCDLSVVQDGEPFINTTFELEHELLVNALSTEITSIGAGGGSIVAIGPSGELTVGPESAGSEPGPACYGRGGVLPTTTDTCMLMGIIDPDGFAGGRMSLDPALSKKAFESLDSVLPFEERVKSAYEVGLNNIAEGLTNISVKYGLDPRDFTLVAFGAAGGMLLPAVLDLVHVEQVMIPPHPGVFSALGLLSADQVYSASRSAYTVLTPDAGPSIEEVYQSMEASLREQMGDRAEGAEFVRSFDGRLYGQSWETPFIPVGRGEIDVAELIEAFHTNYEQRAGHRFDPIPVQGVTYRVHATVAIDKVQYPELPARDEGTTLSPIKTVPLKYLNPDETEAAVYSRDDLRAGDVIEGPAIIRETTSTTFLRAGQTATVGSRSEILIRRAA